MRSQLRTLSKVAADRVARHLVAAGRLVDEDPQAALEQARAARALGARVAVVREAVGETAYAAGEWAEAIAELRTARRMTGDDSALPMIADAERALGRPERALRIAQSPEVQGLAPAERAEMRIVEAGARRDLGQLDAALVTLQDFGLDRRAVAAVVGAGLVRLRRPAAGRRARGRGPRLVPRRGRRGPRRHHRRRRAPPRARRHRDPHRRRRDPHSTRSDATPSRRDPPTTSPRSRRDPRDRRGCPRSTSRRDRGGRRGRRGAPVDQTPVGRRGARDPASAWTRSSA